MSSNKKINSEVTIWYLKISFIILVVATVIVSPSFSIDPTEEETALYDLIENMEEGSKVLVAVNYGPSARYEIEGSLQLITKQLLKKKAGIVFFTLSEMGVESISMGISDALAGYSYEEGRVVYGRNYVDLGYFGGGTVGAGILAKSLKSSRSKDIAENELDVVPLMNSIFSFSDFSAFIEFSSMKIDGSPGAVLMKTLSKDENIPVVAIVTSDMVGEYIPFRDSGKIDVLVKGSQGMAALESSFDVNGVLTRRYSLAAVLLVFVIFVIILFNLVFIKRGKSEPQ
jgi:hypothetical protein